MLAGATLAELRRDDVEAKRTVRVRATRWGPRRNNEAVRVRDSSGEKKAEHHITALEEDMKAVREWPAPRFHLRGIGGREERGSIRSAPDGF